MGGVPRNHQHERLHQGLTRLAMISVEFHLQPFVQVHAVFELQLFDLLGRHAGGDKVAAGHDGRLLDEAVFHGARERV